MYRMRLTDIKVFKKRKISKQSRTSKKRIFPRRGGGGGGRGRPGLNEARGAKPSQQYLSNVRQYDPVCSVIMLHM